MGHTPATLLGATIACVRDSFSVLWRIEARMKGVQIQGKCDFAGRPIISVAKGAKMIFQDGVRIYSATRANPLGLAHPAVLRALAPGASLVLGKGVGLSGAVVCAGLNIEVGEGTIIGAGAMIIDNDFHVATDEWGWATDSTTGARPIKIGRGVFIGARAIILKGVTVGDRAVIGAGAVVTQDVPARQMAVGNPARICAQGNKSGPASAA